MATSLNTVPLKVVFLSSPDAEEVTQETKEADVVLSFPSYKDYSMTILKHRKGDRYGQKVSFLDYKKIVETAKNDTELDQELRLWLE